MAWQDEMIPTLRVLINDMGAEPTYSDGRLEQTLLVAARMVNMDLGYDYTISVELVTISPDPVDELDETFTNLTVLRAGCFIDQSTLRTKAAISGLVARCGPATLDTSGYLDGFKAIFENGLCSLYEQMKKEVIFGNSAICRAILGPFKSNDFDPINIQTIDHYRRNYN